MSQVRDYLVDQLVIAASRLAESHIYRKDPELPLCRLCLMTGMNGRPIPHLPSCAVGRVLRAIEDLKNPLAKPDECPMCGPDCVGGAHRNALREDGTRNQYEAPKKPAAIAALELA